MDFFWNGMEVDSFIGIWEFINSVNIWNVLLDIIMKENEILHRELCKVFNIFV